MFAVGHTRSSWLVFVGAMKDTYTDKIAASRKYIRGFGQHYNYDVTYLEELMDASSGAF